MSYTNQKEAREAYREALRGTLFLKEQLWKAAAEGSISRFKELIPQVQEKHVQVSRALQACRRGR